MSNRKRALVVTNVLKYAIHHRLHLFERLVREGYDVVLAGAGTDEEKAQLERVGVQVHLCSVVPYRLSPGNDFSLFPTIRRLIASERPDVLHLFTMKPILFGKLAAASLGVARRPGAIILSLTGLGRLFLPEASTVQRAIRSFLLRVINRPLAGTSQLLTVETRSDKEELSGLANVPGRAIVVTNGTGVDFDDFSTGEREGPVTFLFAGRLLKSKGVLSFIEAARVLSASGTQARYLVAGGCDPLDPDSVQEDTLNSISDIEGFSFLGEIPSEEIPSLLQQADVVCLPTRYKEGIPRSLLEAAASGCAFIACRTPGWVETMGETSAAGWYVEPSDVQSLVEAMRAAVEQPRQTRNAGEVARRMVLRSNVSCADVQDRYLEAYHHAEQEGRSKRERLRGQSDVGSRESNTAVRHI